MFWMFAAIVAAFVIPYASSMLGAMAEDRIAREQEKLDEEQEALLALAEESAEDIGDIQTEISQIAIEKTRAETKFDLEQIERQMEERLATGRARRGASGLTAAGSPILVRQYVAEQYEKMAQFREQMGEVGADVLGLQEQIRGIETKLKIAGIQFQRTEFEAFKEVRTMEQRYGQFASILDMGANWLSLGYGIKKTQIPGYNPPFESPQIGYGGYKW